MAGSEEPGNKFEDLFEDLDKFFAPIEQVDRPLREGEAGVESAPSSAAAESGAADNPDEGQPAEADPASARPAEPPAPTGEPASEMSGEDWSRLPEAVGDQ